MSEDAVRVEGTSPARVGEAARAVIRRTRQVTRRKFPAEEEIRIAVEGVRRELAVSELCRRQGIHPTICYKWSSVVAPKPANGGRVKTGHRSSSGTELF